MVGDALLSVANLRAGYGGTDVLQDVHLHVSRGEYVCVIGANTAGKSTLLRAISRLVPRSSGTIRFAGHDLMELQSHHVPALGIAHVPEGRQVFPDMTVQENLRLGAYSARRESGVGGRLERVFSLFPRLFERRQQRAGTLSGGEQQMVAVGRALMLEPKLLMLDEPSHGLAPKVVEEMYRSFASVHAAGTTIFLVEQNTAMALEHASRCYVLERGVVVLDGPSRELKENPAVRAAYLGI